MSPEQLRQKLFNFISHKVNDPADAEDIVQETMISLYDSLPLFKGKSSFLTWACSIARHEVADFYRKKKLKQIVFSRLPWLKELVSQALGPELAYQELETKKKIVNTFKRLSEGYARILRLKYVEQLSMQEIARELKLTVKAVESRLTRARLAFQKLYVGETICQIGIAPFNQG
jgi:RNA polymerase sigma-70 factor (ECF subfamily)